MDRKSVKIKMIKKQERNWGISPAAHLCVEICVFLFGIWGKRQGLREEEDRGGNRDRERERKREKGKGSSLLFYTLVVKLSPLQEFSWLCPPSGMSSHFLCLPWALTGLSSASLLPPSALTALWRTAGGHASADGTLLTRHTRQQRDDPAWKARPPE